MATPQPPKAVVTISGGAISVDRDPIVVAGQGHAQVIQWDITTSGYTFPADGIVVADASGQFSGGHVPPGQPARFILTDANTTLGDFKYTIIVTNAPAKPPVPPLDPTIRNQ